MTKQEKAPKSRCVDCDEEFPTIAAETRHMENTGHARYEAPNDRSTS